LLQSVDRRVKPGHDEESGATRATPITVIPAKAGIQ